MTPGSVTHHPSQRSLVVFIYKLVIQRLALRGGKVDKGGPLAPLGVFGPVRKGRALRGRVSRRRGRSRPGGAPPKRVPRTQSPWGGGGAGHNESGATASRLSARRPRPPLPAGLAQPLWAPPRPFRAAGVGWDPSLAGPHRIRGSRSPLL